MTHVLRIATLALICSWGLLMFQSAAASAMREYAVWEVQASVNGKAQAPIRWLSRADLLSSVQIGNPLLTGRWNIQLSYVRDADGLPALSYSLQIGDPPQDVTPLSTTSSEGEWRIIRVPSADDHNELELRVHATKLAVPTSNPQRTPVAAVYPPQALAKGIEGVVMLQVSMDEKGTIQSARVESASTPEVFEAAALTSAATWPLNPLRDDSGQAIAGTVRIPVSFKLEPETARRQRQQPDGQHKPRKKRKR